MIGTRARLGMQTSALALMVGYSGTALAGTFSGRVVDAGKQVALPGATVEIDGTDRSVTTAADGSFTIDLADASSVKLTVSYTGYTAQTLDATTDAPLTVALTDETAPDDIVVTGTLIADRKAIQVKKASNAIVETLFANDVGKLPDQNVAEAVRRLPGLSVANDQGEGRYVIIRGISPNLVNVQLNGQTLPAPEPDARQVKLDDIPSALIASVTVTKSLSADQDANAIGGEVNIRTLTAFDRNQSLFVDARGAYGTFAINSRHPFEGDAQVGGIVADGKLGFVLSGNYSQRPITSQNFQGSANWRAVNGFIVPDNFGLRDYNLVRERAGFVGNFDFHPTETVKLFLRTSYSYYSDDETRDQNLLENQSTFTNQTATTGTVTGRQSIRVRRRIERDNTASIQWGGSADLDWLRIDGSASWTRAEKSDPLRSEVNIRTGGTAVTSDYNIAETPYFFTPRALPAQTAYSLNSVNYDIRDAVETIWQGRLDFTAPVAFGDGSTIKFGAKYLARNKTNDRNFQTFGLTSGRTLNLAQVSFLGTTDFFDGRYTFGPRINYDTFQSLVTTTPSLITLNVASSRNNSLANDYDVDETIIAGYALGTFKLGRLTLLPGVRIESTDDTIRSVSFNTTTPLDVGFNSFAKRGYIDVFPGLNARFDITKDLVIRGAVTTSIARPNYYDLSSFQSVDTTTTPRPTVTLGNPDLNPYRAYNLDLYGEYYLPGQGLLSIGVFYKNLDNPIYTGTVVNGSGTFAGIAYPAIDIIQPFNLDRAYVLGFEANAQVRFTFLPGALDGLGFSANYTHITGNASGTLPGATPRTGNIPLFLQSSDVANGQIFYEKYGFAVRLAYSYRSPYVDTLGATAALDQYTDKNGQLDLNASYQVTKQLSFFFNATNLTDAPNRRYVGTKAQLIELERYDYALRWGFQLHF